MRSLNRVWIILLLVALLLSGCASEKEVCRYACQDADLDFFSYSPATYDGGAVMITADACHCQKDGVLVELW